MSVPPAPSSEEVPAPAGELRPWATHMRGTLSLGLPLVFTLLLQMAIGVVDTVMVGWLGVADLAGGVLAFQAFFVVSIFALGFAQAMSPVVANAIGAGDPVSARRAARMLIWSVGLLALLFTVLLGRTEALFLLLGQDPETAAKADAYLAVVRIAMLANFVLYALRALMAAVEDTVPIVVMMIVLTLLNAALNWALIFGNWGAPALGLEGAAWASAISLIVVAIGGLIYARFARSMADMALTTRFWRPDWSALAKVWRLGLPVTVMILAEAGLFSAASLMVGLIGTVELAAHGIALQLASIAFMVPLGISQAASVRVGSADGRTGRLDAARAGRVSIAIGLAFAGLSALIFLLVPEPMILAFLDEGETARDAVLAVAVPMLAMAAAFQLFDTLQVTAAGALRGLQDMRVPMWIATIAYWGLGLPAGWWLAFHAGFGATGVWGGLVVGLAAAALLLTLRFERLVRV